MLHVWLIPAVVILLVGIAAFYLALKYRGGTGVRTEGRTLTHQPETEADLPPQMNP
jgi:hypothetical protein